MGNNQGGSHHLFLSFSFLPFLQVRCLVVSSTGSVVTSKRVAYHTDSVHKVHDPCHQHKIV